MILLAHDPLVVLGALAVGICLLVIRDRVGAVGSRSQGEEPPDPVGEAADPGGPTPLVPVAGAEAEVERAVYVDLER